MTALATPRQIAAIHTLAKTLGLDEDLRRAVIAAEAGGKRSCSELNFLEAGRVVERLKQEQSKTARCAFKGRSNASQARGARVVDGAYGPKLKALWLSAYNLGVVRERTDAALLAFCERQTGIAHPRWWRESAVAAKAIEALKAWMTREAGVVWPPRGADIADVKLAVIAAQCRRIEARGQTPCLCLGDLDLDDAMQTLGRQLRAATGSKKGARHG